MYRKMTEKSRPQEKNIIRYIRNLFRLEKKLKLLKIYSEIFRIFLSLKKKKIIINQYEHVISGVTTVLNMKVTTIEMER